MKRRSVSQCEKYQPSLLCQSDTSVPEEMCEWGRIARRGRPVQEEYRTQCGVQPPLLVVVGGLRWSIGFEKAGEC